jgi:hypothetical protein
MFKIRTDRWADAARERVPMLEPLDCGAPRRRLWAAVLLAGIAAATPGRAEPLPDTQSLAQAAPGPENQVCFTDSEGRRHFCPAGATCCRAARSGCCAAGALCTGFGCARPGQCAVCGDGLQRSVQLRVKVARGLRTYVNNELARYANCKKAVGGDCVVGDGLARNLANCGRMFGEEAPYQACVARQF